MGITRADPSIDVLVLLHTCQEAEAVSDGPCLTAQLPFVAPGNRHITPADTSPVGGSGL